MIAVVLIEGWPGLRRFRALGGTGLFLAAISALGMVLFITALRHTTVAHFGVIYAAVPFVISGKT